MDRTASSAPGFMTGARYLNSLRDNREVWLDGERIPDITVHKAFTGVVNELARIYDLQSDPGLYWHIQCRVCTAREHPWRCILSLQRMGAP